MAPKNYIDYLLTLEGRYLLTANQRKDLIAYQNGIDGEIYFQTFLNNFSQLSYLKDFEFGSNNHVQIDFLVATTNKLVIFEVKHYSDEWYFESDALKNRYGIEVKSPLLQLQRHQYELQQLLYSCGYQLEIEGYIVFTNPHFIPSASWTQHKSLILFHQLNQLSPILSMKTSQQLLDILNVLTLQSNRHSTYYQKEIITHFDINMAGLRCPQCRKFHTIKLENKKKFITCSLCQNQTKTEELILLNLKELLILKRAPFTLKEAIKWCYPVNEYTIRRVCNKYFQSDTNRNQHFYLDGNKS